MALTLDNLHRTDLHWSNSSDWRIGRGLEWTELVAVQRRINMLITGDPTQNFVSYTLAKYFSAGRPVARMLSLGCGKGTLERQLAAANAFQACDAYDVAAGSINTARQLADKAGYSHINYAVCDINTISLMSQSYDAVWVISAMHHFTALEHVSAQIAQSLKPDGLLILNEYIGPSRFQFCRRQARAMQLLYELLPSAYRQPVIAASPSENAAPSLGRGWRKTAARILDKARDGSLIATAWRKLKARLDPNGDIFPPSLNLPGVRDVIYVDPSEAVRSAEIIPVLRQYFDIIEFKPYGGHLLQFLLSGIAGNFETYADGERWLRVLFEIEDLLETSGEVTSDFAYIVARPLV